MATQSQALTDEPTVLAGLEEGTWYSVQNRGKRQVYVEAATEVPTDASKAKELYAEGHILSVGQVRKESGEEVYVWAKGSGAIAPGRLSYDRVG